MLHICKISIVDSGGEDINPNNDLMDIEDEESTPVTTPDNGSAAVNPMSEHPTFINQPNSVSTIFNALTRCSI